MHRRTLLKLMAAAGTAGCSTLNVNGVRPRVVVVGAGIIGASIAYHLASSGASVTIIDKQGPATHASRGTFAWINATWAKQPQSYHSFSQQGVANWHDLQHELGLAIRWQGSLEWFEGEQRQRRLAEQIDQQIAWGEAAEIIDAEHMAMLEPRIDFAGAGSAAFSRNDGAVDPVVATRALLQAAVELGAVIQYPAELIGVQKGFGILDLHTSKGILQADKLVLATGAAEDAAQQFAGINIPQRSTPGVIAITRPMPRLINRIIVAPGIHMHQRDDGRIVLGEQDGAPQNQAHAARLAERPNDFPDQAIAAQHVGRMLAVAERFLPSIAQATIEDVHIGWRPLPLDGHPVLGASPQQADVYLAIMHSGVTLAPVVGQLVALELIQNAELAQLSEYRPGRNFKRVKRY